MPKQEYIEQDEEYVEAPPVERKRRRSKKGKKKKTQHKGEESSSSGSEMDLEKELKPIRFYIHDRNEMLQQMFRTLKGKQMKKILPDILKKIPLEDLQKLCQDQLAVMSKKRIRYTLAGREMTSSSGTDETETEEEESNEALEALRRRYFARTHQENGGPQSKTVVQQVQADSTVDDRQFANSTTTGQQPAEDTIALSPEEGLLDGIPVAAEFDYGEQQGREREEGEDDISEGESVESGEKRRRSRSGSPSLGEDDDSKGSIHISHGEVGGEQEEEDSSKEQEELLDLEIIALRSKLLRSTSEKNRENHEEIRRPQSGNSEKSAENVEEVEPEGEKGIIHKLHDTCSQV